MTMRVTTEEFRMPDGTLGVRLTMTSKRANSLESGLLSDFALALDEAGTRDAGIILICGGRNFSSGGDVGSFHAAARESRAAAYASEVVPPLQAIVARLIAMPRLVVVAARGAVTGGSAGLLFAADLAVLAPDAFVQPYYSKVGFAPDGGWTALLPERIGAGRALEWLHSDRRLRASELCEAGLATTISDTPEATALQRAGDGRIGTRLATKALIWDQARRARINARLEAETAAFMERIVQPDTAFGMEQFIQRIGSKADV